MYFYSQISARTIETVEGGGVIVVLLKSVDSLKQLYTMAMDVHQRFRTESHQVTTNNMTHKQQATGFSFPINLSSLFRSFIAS